MVESGVEETSVILADNHSTKSMDSDALMLSMSYGSLRGSSEDGDYSSLQDHLSSYEPILELFITPKNSNPSVSYFWSSIHI